MRVGVAYVDVRVNMTKYKTDLNTLATLAAGAATKVNANLSAIGKGYTNLGKQSAGAATGVNRLTSATTKQSKSLLGMIPHVAAVTISYMAMRTAWRSVMSALGAGVEFEQKMSAVKAISRATEEEFKKLSETARELAAQTVFTATQTADALRFLAMAGFNTVEAMAALPGVLNLALIGELELKRATDIATDTLRAFGLEAGEIGKVVDVFTATITRSNTNIEMMGQAMKFAAPVARSLGYEIEEVSAMIGVLSQSGIKAGIAGRGLQQGFIRTMGAARGLGLEIGSRLMDVIRQYIIEEDKLAMKIGRVAAAEDTAMQIKKDYGLIALKTILVLKDNAKAYDDLALAARAAEGEAAKAVTIMMDNVDAAWKLVKSAVQEISINIFSVYGDSLQEFLVGTAEWFRENKNAITDFTTGLIGGVSAIVSSLNSITTPVQSILRHLWDLLSFSDNLPPAVVGAAGIGMIAWMLGGPVLGAVALGIAGVDAALRPLNLSIGSLWQYADKKISDFLIEVARGLAGLDEPGMAAAAALKETQAGFELMGGIEWGWAEDFGEYADEAARQAIYMSAAMEDFADLAPDVRAAWDKALAFEEYKAEVDKSFAGMEEALKIKFGSSAEAAMKAAKIAMHKGYKAVIKDQEKALSDHLKFIEKTDELSIKQNTDKYEVLIAAAKKHGEDTLKSLKAAKGVELKEYQDAAVTEISIAEETKRRIAIISKDKHDAVVKDIEDMVDEHIAQLDRDEKAVAANAKAIIDAQKSLLKSMSANDEGYFVLKKKIRDEELALALIDAKSDAERAALRKAYQKQEIDDMKKIALASEDMIAGMKVGLLDYLESAKTWGQQGKIIFDAFISGTTSAFSDTFYAIITGDMESIGEIWDALWKSMLKTFMDILAEMLVRWMMSGIMKLLAGTGSGSILGMFSSITSASSSSSSSVVSDFSKIASAAKNAYTAVSSLWTGGSAAAGSMAGANSMAGILSSGGATGASVGVGGEMAGGLLSTGGGTAAGGAASIGSVAAGVGIAALVAYGAYETYKGMGQITAPSAGVYKAVLKGESAGDGSWDDNARMQLDTLFKNSIGLVGSGTWQPDHIYKTIASITSPYDNAMSEEGGFYGVSKTATSLSEAKTLWDNYIAKMYGTDAMGNPLSYSNQALIPAYASGTGFVPRDMLAMVHRGERITPAEENQDLTRTIVDAINSTGGSDRPIVINLHIDGKQIGNAVAKQYRHNKNLIHNTRLAVA